MLRPSRIEGIGVFATHSIQEGTYLALFCAGEASRIRQANKRNQALVSRHGIPQGGRKYICPVDFRRMSVGWYLNHCKSPNASHKNYRYLAVRDIALGEEITIDYATLYL